MIKELPDQNKRVDELVKRFSNGNRSEFVRLLNKDVPEKEKISQQNFSRIFNIEKKTGKYPRVPKEISDAILSKIENLSRSWFFAGEGDMINDDIVTLPKNDNKDLELIELRAITEVLTDYILELRAESKKLPLTKVVDEYGQDLTLQLRKLKK